MVNGFGGEKMAQHKATPDSIRTSHTQKPFVRLSDIVIAYVSALIFVVGVEFLGFIVFATLSSESANDILPLGALLFMGVVSSHWIWVGNLLSGTSQVQTSVV